MKRSDDGVGLRYASHQPDAVDKLVLSNSITYDSWPIQTITDLGLPSTINEKSVDEVQEMLDGLYRQTLDSDDPSEEFVEGMKAQWQSKQAAVSLSRNAIATNTTHTTEIDYDVPPRRSCCGAPTMNSRPSRMLNSSKRI